MNNLFYQLVSIRWVLNDEKICIICSHIICFPSYHPIWFHIRKHFPQKLTLYFCDRNIDENDKIFAYMGCIYLPDEHNMCLSVAHHTKVYIIVYLFNPTIAISIYITKHHLIIKFKFHFFYILFLIKLSAHSIYLLSC